ncbi:golgin subfamily A member 2 [Calliphora vicina]|uniref:golgin subfamily A member 2 n=1 Tax=Calliphora vicina TaxID=7373 RepID=UPI00325B8114
MPEESKESKAKKLAAARKKLKEYQQRGSAPGTNAAGSYADSATNSGHVSSNISERSESELQLNGSCNDINNTDIVAELEQAAVVQKEELLQTENVNYFAMDPTPEPAEGIKAELSVKPDMFSEETFTEGTQNINAIQVLITEKSQLTMEVNKFRTLCREKDLEMEELRVQHNNATKRVEELTQRLLDIQKQQEQQRLHNAELQHKLAQARAVQEDHGNHINELQQQLTMRDERLKQLDADFKEKSNELEMSQLRIRQLSDENNITKDNRVETLTQTQFMYEQQIRDLQAMVQQLTQDKEQANTQYQTYVQQLNAQVQQLTERNTELMDESTKLQEREKQWLDHIQHMEKEIQKNISRQAEVKEEKEKESSSETNNEQLKTLQERLNEFEAERYEFQLKIKSQEDRLNSQQLEVKQKDIELEQLKEYLENITSEQPDKTKLLATMESDKVAASRALTQNVELKKQLDELELRFVQLTNDKADLMNRLDSEQYANREMHTNYASMEERLRTIDERFKFKDEEMIRLSHENEELKKKLENKIYYNEENERDDVEHHDHEHNHDHHDHHHDEHDECDHDHQQGHNEEHNHHHAHSEEHKHDHHEHDCHDHHEHDHHQHEPKHNENHSDDQESCQEATEDNITNYTQLQTPKTHKKPAKSPTSTTTTPRIATEEAVEKLQQRFTQLMTQCADLTDEKQRLEHLVMQLQSETETIGEYIALYQNQRRILKQREYEKAAQTAMLQAEREEMRERLTLLNNLVNSLGMEMPQNQHLKQQINEALAQNVAIDVTSQHNEAQELNNSADLASLKALDAPASVPAYQTPTKDLNSSESQQILHKIQDIITEIKENTKELPTITHSVDHLNCCSGKFEVV